MTSVDTNGDPIISELGAELDDYHLWDLSYATKFGAGWEPAEGIDHGAWIFFRGVSEVNWDPALNPDTTADTTYSEFIRSYTSAQYGVRFGSALSEEMLQETSNRIAEAIINDVIDLGIIYL